MFNLGREPSYTQYKIAPLCIWVPLYFCLQMRMTLYYHGIHPIMFPFVINHGIFLLLCYKGFSADNFQIFIFILVEKKLKKCPFNNLCCSRNNLLDLVCGTQCLSHFVKFVFLHLSQYITQDFKTLSTPIMDYCICADHLNKAMIRPLLHTCNVYSQSESVFSYLCFTY